MAKIKDFVKSLAEKAGYATDNAELVAFMELPEAEVELPPVIVNFINQNTIGLKNASQNPEVRKALKPVFFAEAYNGLDAELVTLMDEINLPEDVRKSLLEEQSSTKRASQLARKIKEIESENAKKSGNSDKTELQSKVNELNGLITKLQKEHTDAIQRLQEETAATLLNKDIEFDLNAYKYALPDKMPHSAKIATAKNLFDAEMRAKGAFVKIVDGVKKLVRADGTEYTDANHRTVNYNEFMSGVLANNDLLLASNNGDDTSPPRQQYDSVAGLEKGKVNQNFVDALDSDLANIGVK